MTELKQLLDENRFPTVIDEISTLVDESINQLSGITGMAVKGAITAGKKVDADIVKKGLRRVLPDVIEDLAPHWSDFEASSENDFGSFLGQRSDQVTDSILQTADRHAESLNNSTLQKAYGPMRGKGAKIIAPHIPPLGAVLQRNMA